MDNMKNPIVIRKLAPREQVRAALILIGIPFLSLVLVTIVCLQTAVQEKKRADALEKQVLQLKNQKTKCETYFSYCEDTMEDLHEGWKEANNKCISSLEKSIKMIEEQ